MKYVGIWLTRIFLDYALALIFFSNVIIIIAWIIYLLITKKILIINMILFYIIMIFYYFPFICHVRSCNNYFHCYIVSSLSYSCLSHYKWKLCNYRFNLRLKTFLHRKLWNPRFIFTISISAQQLILIWSSDLILCCTRICLLPDYISTKKGYK